jgi:hypothetical protein
MTRILQQISPEPLTEAQKFFAEAHRFSFPMVLCAMIVLTNVLSALATLAAAG